MSIQWSNGHINFSACGKSSAFVGASGKPYQTPLGQITWNGFDHRTDEKRSSLEICTTSMPSQPSNSSIGPTSSQASMSDHSWMGNQPSLDQPSLIPIRLINLRSQTDKTQISILEEHQQVCLPRDAKAGASHTRTLIPEECSIPPSWLVLRTMVEWLIQAHSTLERRRDALLLAVNILDRCLAKRAGLDYEPTEAIPFPSWLLLYLFS
ncbi:hypothetical protein BJ742DRAFT_428636 [Cladochytrium replicatum]|nr:hypothetical protein BJ742DRAFT_428636 [Cladochytrium replicatum]